MTGGVTLDVLGEELPAKDHPLFGMDNVILSPHLAAFSADFGQIFWSCSAAKIIDASQRLAKTPILFSISICCTKQL